ncbi:SH3 domain-containing protein [Acidaminobacter sp. JC074]|uniref:SH3 domain-containing protein n=1 Tax=Acidaminobacter sp. JC074 TaxID=2530199 RepID=UPI001F0D27D0|nr:SH3 domain-containing protein [Acidaminobacter sp. JC074]
MRKYKVIKARQPETLNPIKLKEGDSVIVKKESNPQGDWAGWLYCESRDNAGWVPKQLVRRKADLGCLDYDYDAHEFELEIGEVIQSEYILNGWVWGYKVDEPGIHGWTPLNHVESYK